MPLSDGVWDLAILSQCAYCRHRAGVACRAFPGSIPDRIIRNAYDHRRPYIEDGKPADVGTHGDQPITFEPRDDVRPEVLAALYRTLDQKPPNETTT